MLLEIHCLFTTSAERQQKLKMTNRFYISSFILVLTIVSVVPRAWAQNLPRALTQTVSWTCHAFYLPARSIWKRTVQIEFDADVVRSLMIDGVTAYSFQLQDARILTAIDGEQIQFNVIDQTWISNLRGMVTSQGRCEK